MTTELEGLNDGFEQLEFALWKVLLSDCWQRLIKFLLRWDFGLDDGWKTAIRLLYNFTKKIYHHQGNSSNKFSIRTDSLQFFIEESPTGGKTSSHLLKQDGGVCQDLGESWVAYGMSWCTRGGSWVPYGRSLVGYGWSQPIISGISELFHHLPSCDQYCLCFCPWQ